MIFDKDGNTTVVFQENVSLKKFVQNFREAFPRIQNDHLVINLFSFGKLSTSDLLEFLELSNRHRGAGKSFVLVTNAISYEHIPDEICVVPTLKEARDVIEMEEIERDLEL